MIDKILPTWSYFLSSDFKSEKNSEMTSLHFMELLLVKKVNIEKSAKKSPIHSFLTPANQWGVVQKFWKFARLLSLIWAFRKSTWEVETQKNVMKRSKTLIKRSITLQKRSVTLRNGQVRSGTVNDERSGTMNVQERWTVRNGERSDTHRNVQV